MSDKEAGFMCSIIKVLIRTAPEISGKRNRGIVLSLPTDENTLDNALGEIEFAPHQFEYLSCEIGEVLVCLENHYESGCIYALNYLAQCIATLSADEKETFKAAILHWECDNRYLYLFELIQVVENLEEYILFPEIQSEMDYGAYLSMGDCEYCDDLYCVSCSHLGETSGELQDGQYTEYGYVYRKNSTAAADSPLEYGDSSHKVTINPHESVTVSLFLFLE